MIILIDDKKKRQEDFGWTEHKFNQYANIIQQIYSIEDLKSRSKDIFQKGNIVLYHESFLDNTSIKKEAAIKRSQLEEYAKANSDFYLAIFSGSKSSRSLSKNIAHLPVSIVFQNLGVLSHKTLEGDVNLKYLLFGETPEIEEELSLKLDIANREIDSEPAKIAQTKNLFLRPTKGNIQNAIENAEVEILYNDVSDEKLSEKVKDWLAEKEFDNIFIPICFGPVLSDFNGLRLATHIRCTESPNQLKNIFIYSFVGIEYLFNNEYFNILKTKNVYLVDYKKSTFTEVIQRDFEPLTLDELPKELKKIRLELPKNYEDSHSIANEWAIFRWALTINTRDGDIEQIIQKVNNQLYFKYLCSIYPKEEINTIPEKKLKIEYFRNPKVLYIDDEADKGWYEIFSTILFDINSLDFQYLDKEFNSKTQDEIIKISMDKIISDDIDLVILDFRLHPNDFQLENVQNVTGLKLLKEIKDLNPGIQVIIFSATNKVWNLQALQEAGADGFIIKESPELSNNNITLASIQSFIEQVSKCLTKSYLKEIWFHFDEIKTVFSKNPLTTKYFAKQLNEQLNGVKYQNLLLQELDTIFEILNTTNENRFNLSMIMLYKLLEYLNEIFYQKTSSDKAPLFYDGVQVDYFDKNSKTWKKQTEKINFYNRSTKSNEQIKIKIDWLKSTSNKILNLSYKKLKIIDNSIFLNLISLTEYRNDFIHSDTSNRSALRLLEEKDILKWTTSITNIIKSI